MKRAKKFTRQSSIAEIMQTSEGQELFQLIAKHFDQGLSASPPKVAEAIHTRMCFLGSEKWVEGLVWQILTKG